MSTRQSSAAHRERRWWEAPETQELNMRLNESEERLRKRLGAQLVDDLIVQFRATAECNPRLFQELYAKRDPYRWLAQHWAPRHERTQKGVKILRSALAQRYAH